MSNASPPVRARTSSRIERSEPWIAALISALVQVLLLLVLLSASALNLNAPAGASAGGRMKVDFVGQTQQPVTTPTKPTPPRKPVVKKKRPAAPKVRSTLVEHAKDPLPPDAPPEPMPTPQPPTPELADDAWMPVATRSPPRPTERRPETWTGQPPGMLPQDFGPNDDGMSRSDLRGRGNGRTNNASGPSMEAGGYQVVYDLRSETQLRAWKEQGMKEIAIILPGTDQRMICPLETALRRGSGPCRLLPADSPELKALGDAREGINMLQVYHRGDSVWSGPGPYR